MAVQKFRKSKSKTMSRRRSNDKRSLLQVFNCPECSMPKLPHRVCPHCNAYKGKTVVEKKKS